MIYLFRNTLMFCIYSSIFILGYLFACHINGFRNVNADLYFDALNNYLLKRCTIFPYFLSGNLNGSMHF